MQNKLQLHRPGQTIIVDGNKYKLTQKFIDWEQCFLDKSSKDTYGNATQSAIKAYNLDPIGQYDVGGQIGSANLKKHHNIARKWYEKQGKTPGQLLDIMWNMMLARKDPDLMFYLMKIMDVSLPEYKPTTNATYIAKQENNQLNIGGDMSLTFIKEEGEEK